MITLSCKPNTWYIVDVCLHDSKHYVISSIQPLDGAGLEIKKESRLSLRAKRNGRRVFYAPKNCTSIRLSLLEQSSFATANTVTIKAISFFKAAWLIGKRLKHFYPENSFYLSTSVRLRNFLFPLQLYNFYEETYEHKKINECKLDTDEVDTLSPVAEFKVIPLEQLQKGYKLEPEKWIIFSEQSDRWITAGVALLKNWQALHPAARVISFDEQLVCKKTGETQPWLKPEWNVDLFLSSAYQGHSVAFRADLLELLLPRLCVKDISSVDELVDALFLLLVADYSQEYLNWITHCPEVVMQVRKPALTEIEIKHWQAARQQRLKDLLGLDSSSVSRAGRLGLGWKVTWPIPKQGPLVSLCIPTRNGLNILQPCLESILQLTRYKNFEILVIDNQSDCPQTLQYLADVRTRDKRVRVLRYDAPFNFAAINNFAVAHAQGEVIGLVNNDIEPRHPEWLEEMLAHALRPNIGCVGAKLYYPNGTIQHGGVVLGIGGIAGHAFRFEPETADGYQGRLQHEQNYSAVTAACLLVRKELYDAVGGLDERLAVNYNDVDFCLKVRSLGYRNLWTPHAQLTHHESVSRGKDSSYKQRRRAQREFKLMRKKWGHLLDADPAYNPHLTLTHEDFSLR